MKITVEPVSIATFNAESSEFESLAATRVTWQTATGGKRDHADIAMESSQPQDMLRAAAAFFEANDA